MWGVYAEALFGMQEAPADLPLTEHRSVESAQAPHPLPAVLPSTDEPAAPAASSLVSFDLACWLFGHDDIFKIDGPRLCVECTRCLRQTQGW